jgi:uncharacterized membrane protein YeaQ/YmgE (transglycosylase-associated protein family)
MKPLIKKALSDGFFAGFIFAAWNAWNNRNIPLDWEFGVKFYWFMTIIGTVGGAIIVLILFTIGSYIYNRIKHGKNYQPPSN